MHDPIFFEGLPPTDPLDGLARYPSNDEEVAVFEAAKQSEYLKEWSKITLAPLRETPIIKPLQFERPWYDKVEDGFLFIGVAVAVLGIVLLSLDNISELFTSI